MIARIRETVHPVRTSAGLFAARGPAKDGPPLDQGSSRIASVIKRATAIGALGWLGYIGYLLRDCPRSGAICHQSNAAISALVVAVGIVLLGHVVAIGLARRHHDHAVP